MPTCLGLYIEDNIIKYAKVSKDNDTIKIDSFGIKFYDKIQEAIHQVIEETYSYKTPISINVSNETYNYFSLFSLLNKKDMQNVISTEFESLCEEKGINKEAFESRYVLVNDLNDKEKVKAIHVSANKADITKKMQQLEGYRTTTISPMGTTIGNLVEFKDKQNVIIVNIEEKTTVTTIIDKKVEDVRVLEEGTKQILDNINVKENSYLKAYEICKNTTIYTSEGKDLQYEENEYLEQIMPTLYSIVGSVRNITEENLSRIEKIYITGTASVINNIDIYFQEYLKDIKCEILKPYFIQNVQAKVNMKDYIEVNSAIALALQGLGDGLKGMNFRKESFMDKLPEWLTADVGGGKKLKKPTKEDKKSKFNFKLNFDWDFKSEFTASERNLIRLLSGVLIFVIAYCGLSMFINARIQKKELEINEASKEVTSQISFINKDLDKIKTNTSKYVSMKEKLEELNNKITEKNRTKKAIPNLLSGIMFNVPTGVQITSIENSTSTHVIIKVQSKTYEQIGYFKAKLKTEAILVNVTSDSGQNQDGVVKVTIEGDLP